MNRTTLRNIILTGALAALTAALTILAVPVAPGGYIHAGDAVVYLAGCLLPTPFAMAAAAIGGSLADLAKGYVLWIPATFLIKATIAALFSAKREKILTRRNALMLLPAAAITLGGYFAANGIILGWPAAAPLAIWDVLQCVLSAALFAALGAAMDRAGLKKRLSFGA